MLSREGNWEQRVRGMDCEPFRKLVLLQEPKERLKAGRPREGWSTY